MFLRIYSGIALSIIVALGVVYATYKISFNQRLSSYSQSVLQGSLNLIADGYQRQLESNKKRWLELVSQISGFDLKFSQVETSNVPPWRLTIEKNNKLRATVRRQKLQLDLRLNKIEEQQFRAIALLALNEMALNPQDDQQKTLTQINQLYPFDLSLVDISRLTLDPQQKLRLNSGNVVVATSEQEGQFLVLVKANQGKILRVGPINEFEPLTTDLLIILVFLTILITSLTTYWFVFKLERRLNVVNRILDDFGPSKLETRVPIMGNDVITRLGLKVNEMADRIEELLAHQKEITQAVSHELRTPLARIKFRMQILTDFGDVSGQAVTQKEVESRVAGIGKDIQQLESLIDEILALHKLDINPLDYQKRLISLSSIIDSVADSCALTFPHLRIENQVSQPLKVLGNARDISRLIENLLGNACKHAKSQVKISAGQTNHSIDIHIEDDGAGIPKADRERIFKPFVTLKSKENQKVKGYGLGLAIVQRIAKLNQAKVVVNESNLGGAKFQLVCPQVSQTEFELTT